MSVKYQILQADLIILEAFYGVVLAYLNDDGIYIVPQVGIDSYTARGIIVDLDADCQSELGKTFAETFILFKEEELIPASESYVLNAVVEEFLETTLAANQALPSSTSYQDIDGFDTPEFDNLTGVSLNPTTGVITCSETGHYRIEFQTSLDQYSGSNRTSAEIRLTRNGSLVKGTLQYGYHRQNTEGFDNYSFSKTVSLVMGDTLQVQARNRSSSRLQQVLSDSTVLRIKKIKA